MFHDVLVPLAERRIIRMKENLFSNVYQVRKMIFGDCVNDEEAMEQCRNEVFGAIEKDEVPKNLKFLMFKMTNRCNSDCEYCSHAISSNSGEKKVDVSLEMIQKTIREAGELGATALSINGGEPLMRSDICDIIKTALECHITPVLMTNGLLLPNRWKELGESGLKYIIISFDSLDKLNYERQRGASYEKALEGIEAAIKMREKYGNVNIHVTTVLTRENQDLLIDLIRFMTNKGIYVQISPYHHFNPHQEDKLSIDNPFKINALVEQLLKMKKEGYLIANSDGFIRHLPEFFINHKWIPDDYKCLIGYTNLFIDAYMNVRPCWASCFENLGNLSQNSLKELWMGEKMKRYRKQMLRGECEGCWYLCTGEVTMFLNNML